MLGRSLRSIVPWLIPILSHNFLLDGSSNRFDFGINILLFFYNPDILKGLPFTIDIVISVFFSGLKLISPIVLNLSWRKNLGSRHSSLVLMYLKLTQPTSSSCSLKKNILSILTLSSNLIFPIFSTSSSDTRRLVNPWPSLMVLLRLLSKIKAKTVNLVLLALGWGIYMC